MRIPTLEQIVKLNRSLIEKYGGDFNAPDNLRNSSSLRWVLHSVQHTVVFGHDRYPTLAHKAALIAWEIITAHVFFDGNKRPGMAAALVFLWVNAFELEASEDEVVDIALRVATHNESGLTYDSLVGWLEQRMRRR